MSNSDSNIIDYPVDFLLRARRIFPNNTVLHENIMNRSPDVGNFLPEETKFSAEEMLAALDGNDPQLLEQLREKATHAVEVNRLRDEWQSIYDAHIARSR